MIKVNVSYDYKTDAKLLFLEKGTMELLQFTVLVHCKTKINTCTKVVPDDQLSNVVVHGEKSYDIRKTYFNESPTIYTRLRLLKPLSYTQQALRLIMISINSQLFGRKWS